MTSVKFNLDGEVRRLATSHFDFDDWEKFCQQLGELFGKDLRGSFLTYVDGEGDTITVQSAAELKEAQNCIYGLLKFNIFTKKPKRAKSRPAPEAPREAEKEKVEGETSTTETQSEEPTGFFGPPWMRPWCRRGPWPHGPWHHGPWHGHHQPGSVEGTQGRCGRWAGNWAANPEWQERKREWKDMFAKRGDVPEWARSGNAVQFSLPDAEVTSMPLLVWARRFVRFTQVDGRSVLTVDSDKVSFAHHPGSRFFMINHPDGTVTFQLAQHSENKLFLTVSPTGDLEVTPTETKLKAIPVAQGEQLQDPWVRQMQQLESMGFVPEMVAPLLTKFAGDIDSVVRHLFEG